MATFTVVVGADDGDWYGATFRAGEAWFYLCHESLDFYNWTRFPAVTIPKNSTIDSAYWKGFFADARGDQSVRIRAFDEDNASAPVSIADYNGRDKTTAFVDWSAGPTGGYPYDDWITSDDIKTIIQEIVNRAGWSSGNAIVICMDGDTGGSESCWCRSQEDGYDAELIVTWTPPSAFQGERSSVVPIMQALDLLAMKPRTKRFPSFKPRRINIPFKPRRVC